MPTGYTAELHDGEQSFEDFVLRCARGMGALITMRDAPWDAPIPDEFEPGDYHDKKLQEARARLKKLGVITPATAAKMARQEHQEAVQRRQEVEQERQAIRERYEAMLECVEAWEPPTAEHIGFKEFMADQLRESIKFDASPYSWDVDPELGPQEWVEKERADAERDIAYHTAEREKEIERARGRTQWVQALKASLNGVTA